MSYLRKVREPVFHFWLQEVPSEFVFGYCHQNDAVWVLNRVVRVHEAFNHPRQVGQTYRLTCTRQKLILQKQGAQRASR